MVRLFRTPPFPTVFAIGFFQEVAFFLLVNLPGRLQQLGIITERVCRELRSARVAAHSFSYIPTMV